MNDRHRQALEGIADIIESLDLDEDWTGDHDKEECDPVDEPDPPRQPVNGKTKPSFGAPDAPWNLPIRGLKKHPQNDRWLKEMHRVCPGLININGVSRRWSPAIYYFDGSTPKARVDPEWPWSNMKKGERVPWNPLWTPPDDWPDNPQVGDAYSIIINQSSGHCFIIWETRYDRKEHQIHCGAAYEIPTHAKGSRTKPPANIYEKGNGFQPNRACGIPHYAILVTREELESGHIPHALSWAYPRPTKGAKVSPATKGTGRQGGGPGRGTMGLRVAWDLSDNDIEKWSKKFKGPLKNHMITVAECIRDYGFVTTDHGGNESKKVGSTQFENDISARWKEIGFVGKPIGTALHGLLKPLWHKAWVVEEPVFPGGDFNRTAVYK